MLKRLYVQQDANFNVTGLVDTSGNVQERYIYDPYGAVTILAANWTTRGSSSYSWVYGHQGGRLDNATGLYDFRSRDYSPTLGRWMENDPKGFGGGDTNLYRSLANDPMSLRDSSGLAADDGSGNIVIPRPVNPPKPSIFKPLQNAFMGLLNLGSMGQLPIPGFLPWQDAAGIFGQELYSGAYNAGQGITNFIRNCLACCR